ncbi:MAG: hypothetical protein GX657_11475, partial [Chloroflexi bacterium]|nr:hypothetical protein [Chloroflexota bacterium]
DRWLRAFWRLEPRLAGVMNSVTLIDANRGWSLVGGRNQVLRYTDILHNAEDGAGWRALMRKLSLSYWATDMGAVCELGRDGAGGPLRALYHVDSARCRLTGKRTMPLEYHPAAGGVQEWAAGDFLRVASMPSDDEAFRGLGFSAVSRCVEIARLLYAVLQHDQEQVGARAPKGLLLLQGISETQWEESLAAREADMASLERRYYGGVQVLASSGIEQVDAKLVALSQLPQNFDAKMFLDLSMYGYALCFGYDPSEFWPVQFGALGRGNETEVQHRKATGKGGLDFALSLQEQLQNELPGTLAFEFEQRDEAGELTTAALAQAKLNVVTTAYKAGLGQGESLLTRDEARSLLVDAGIIPPEWTEAEEDVQVADTQDVDRWLDTAAVRRAMARWPEEEIVVYSWPSRRLRVLSKISQMRRTERRRPRRRTRREDAADGVLYEDDLVTITEADVDTAIAQARRRVGDEFAELLTAPTMTDDDYAALEGEG